MPPIREQHPPEKDGGTRGRLYISIRFPPSTPPVKHRGLLKQAPRRSTWSANSGDIVNLSWAAQSGATGYRVYRRQGVASTDSSNPNPFRLIARLGPDETSYADYGGQPVRNAQPRTENGTTDTPEFTVNVYDSRINPNIPQEVFVCSLEERVNESGQQTEITNTINGNSRYINVVSNHAANTVTPTLYSLDPQAFPEGDSGTTPTQSDFIAAADIFEDREAYPASIWMDGGQTTVAFQRQIQSVISRRRWTMFTLSTPENQQTATESIDYRTLQLNINDNNGALFNNDCFVYDPFSDMEVAIPASADAAGLLAFTDRIANASFSPAGYRRGLVLNRLRCRHRFSNAEKDRMSSAQVNYFESERAFGILLKEAYTLQSDLSALSFIAVRRIINIAEESTHRALKIFLHEPNDEISEAQIVALLRDFYELMVDARMIRRFNVYAETGSADIAMGNRNVFTLIEPLIPIIRIRHTTVITRQGANFSEVIEQVS